jgi:hypothetical protein
VISSRRPAAGVVPLLPGVRWVLVIAAASGERSSFAPQSTTSGTWQIGPGRDDSVGIAVHLLGLWPLCFVVRRSRIWFQYARASRLAHGPNPQRI